MNEVGKTFLSVGLLLKRFQGYPFNKHEWSILLTMTVPMSETSFAVIVSFNTSISIGRDDCSHVEFHDKPKLKVLV